MVLSFVVAAAIATVRGRHDALIGIVTAAIGQRKTFAPRGPLTAQDIQTELKATRPLSVVMAEKVQLLREWAQGRCVRAD